MPKYVVTLATTLFINISKLQMSVTAACELKSSRYSRASPRGYKGAEVDEESLFSDMMCLCVLECVCLLVIMW